MLMKRSAVVFMTLVLATATPCLAKEEKAKEEKKIEKRVVIRDGKVYSHPLIKDGRFGPGSHFFSKNYIGVRLTPLTSELRTHFGVKGEAGVLVAKVTENSPAARAGLKAGDVITSIDGKAVEWPEDLSQAIGEKKAAEQVRIDFVRDRLSQQVFVEVAERDLVKLEGHLMPELRHGQALGPETAERLEKFFKSDEFQGKLNKFRDCSEIQGRVQELEARLKELEKRLEKK